MRPKPRLMKGRIMADAKNDASTDIESKVKGFAKDLTSWSEKWLKDKQKTSEKKKDGDGWSSCRPALNEIVQLGNGPI